MPADTSGTGCLSRGHPRLTLPSRHYRNIPKSSPALRRRGHDRLGRYAGYAEAVLFFDDQQAEAGQLCCCRLSSRLSSLAPSGSLYLVFTGATPQPVYFATMVLLDHRACRMVAESGGLAQASPSRRSWLGTALFTAGGWKPPPFVAQGGGWKTRFIPTRQDGILLPIPARGQRDDALRLRQGLGERAGGQESGPAGGAAGPRRLLPGPYSSGGSSAWRAPAPRIPRKRPAWSVIQQPVLHGPDHDLLLRAQTQLHLNGVDGVSDGNQLDFPCLGNRGV